MIGLTEEEIYNQYKDVFDHLDSLTPDELLKIVDSNRIGPMTYAVTGMTDDDDLLQAATQLVDGAADAPKSDCEHCGDGRTAVVWKQDLERLRKVVDEKE